MNSVQNSQTFKLLILPKLCVKYKSKGHFQILFTLYKQTKIQQQQIKIIVQLFLMNMDAKVLSKILADRIKKK